jgi:hypothetical protein
MRVFAIIATATFVLACDPGVTQSAAPPAAPVIVAAPPSTALAVNRSSTDAGDLDAHDGAADMKIPECKRLIAVINSAQKGVKDVKPDDPRALSRFADEVASTSALIARADCCIDEWLDQLQAEFVRTLDNMSRAARTAATSKSAAVMTNAAKDISWASDEFSRAINAINDYCGATDDADASADAATSTDAAAGNTLDAAVTD